MQGDNKKTAEPRQGPHKCIFQIICPWRRSRGPATSVVSHVPMIPRSSYPAAPSSAIRTSVGHASSPRPLDLPLLLHSQPNPERSGLMGILSTIVQHAAFPWRWTTSKEPPAYSTIANDLVITTTPSASAAESMNPHPYFYPSNITAHDAFVGLPGVHMDCTIDTTAYNIPENLEACLRKNPNCIHILGVLSAFREPPSILQIARVLGWTSEVAFEI
ncbi:hypothetical protein B0H11DRAFT_1009052 [Mycena galericulata]|nr:hypothetical protein B0H11DRAFT_1009052 [Mycena galericulata]